MENSKDIFGDRIKGYEDVYRTYLPEKLPVIIRLDGKAFHTLTKDLIRPFDDSLINLMDDVALHLCKNVQNCVLSYQQSDEISLLVHNYKNEESQAMFGNNMQKIVSVVAGIASSYFSVYSSSVFKTTRFVTFDCRAFTVPEHEIVNALYWRQADCRRNAIQSIARTFLSRKELYKKNISAIIEMLNEKNISLNDYKHSYIYGRCCYKNDRIWKVDNNIPVFYKEKKYIENIFFGNIDSSISLSDIK